MGEPRVVVDDLWLSYRRKSRRGLPRWRQRTWAIRGITFSVEAGELLGIVGANGSGKTTLLRTVAGVFRPTKGQVVTRGKVGGLVELRPDADRDLSVAERVVMSGILCGFRRSDRSYLEDLVTGFGGLDRSVLEAPVYTMSTGMLLRLEMSLLLHAECDVLAVDELLMSADASFRSKCLDRIAEICTRGGSAILSAHDPSLVLGCDRVLHMEKGVFVEPITDADLPEEQLGGVAMTETQPDPLQPPASKRDGASARLPHRFQRLNDPAH